MAARLEDGERALELAVVGYQHGETADVDNDYDGNWVVARVVARDGERVWQAEAPAFLAWELSELVEWFLAVADRADERMFFSGFEPDLQFEADCSGASPVITAVVAKEFLPPDADRKAEEHSLAFTLDAAAVRAFAEALAADATAVPVRVIQPDGYAAQIANKKQ